MVPALGHEARWLVRLVMIEDGQPRVLFDFI